MRIRAAVAIVSLLLPAASSAQRIPLPGTERHPGRDPLPRQPAPIANELAYKRWRISVETYPLVSYFQAPGFTGLGAASSWASLGAGTRADYLVNRYVSATLDVTSSFIGGPATVNTAELGTRLHPEWAEHALHPYVDLRVGYIATYNKSLGTIDNGYADPVGTYGPAYSRGFGLIGGGGLEYALTRTWSLTTGASVVRSRMTPHDLSRPEDRSYTITGFRYMLGVRYNPVTLVRSPGGDTR
jgi:hypothetical protein